MPCYFYSAINRWLTTRHYQCSLSRYHETNGVPAIFPRLFFDALLALEGDRGAKQIIHTTNPDQLIAVPAPEAGTDIDTRDDLEILLPASETTGVPHDNAHD